MTLVAVANFDVDKAPGLAIAMIKRGMMDDPRLVDGQNLEYIEVMDIMADFGSLPLEDVGVEIVSMFRAPGAGKNKTTEDDGVDRDLGVEVPSPGRKLSESYSYKLSDRTAYAMHVLSR